MCVWNFRTLKLASTLIKTNINLYFNGSVVLSYVQGVSEKITHILKHKRSKLLTNHNKPSTAYFHAPRSETFLTPRNQCNFVYYGQTERSLKTRIAEHKKAVASFDPNSKVGSHVHQFNRNMNFANVKVVGTVQRNSVLGLITRNMWCNMVKGYILYSPFGHLIYWFLRPQTAFR